MPLNEPSLSRKLPRIALAASVLGLALTGCSAPGNYNNKTGSADFTRTVFVGDSLTAGFQSGSLLDTAQPHGYANLIAQQVPFKITLPLIAPPGAPAVLELQSYTPPAFPVIVQAPGETTGRDNPNIVPSDVAVPGALVNDVLNTAAVPDPTTGQEEITQLVLGFPALLSGTSATQFSLTEQWNPTTVFVWIGNNDALDGVIGASCTLYCTPLATFQAEYTETIGAIAQKTSAHLIIANIPDVTLIPYLIPQAELVEILVANGVPAPEAPLLLEAMGINTGDSLLLPAVADFEAELEVILGGGAPYPLPAGDVLSAAEKANTQAAVAAYNQVIAGVAAGVNATLVDINAEFEQAAANGVTADGYTATFAFLNGLFSLDGIHPTDTGYAVLANKFIDTINADLDTKIADVDLDAVAKADPLYPPNLAAAAQSTTSQLRRDIKAMHITPASAKAIRHATAMFLRSKKK